MGAADYQGAWVWPATVRRIALSLDSGKFTAGCDVAVPEVRTRRALNGRFTK
jgi:hypothetical protein